MHLLLNLLRAIVIPVLRIGLCIGSDKVEARHLASSRYVLGPLKNLRNEEY